MRAQPKETRRIPQLGITGNIGLSDERRLRDAGALYKYQDKERNDIWQKAHYVVPAPLMKRMVKDQVLRPKIRWTEDGIDFFRNWREWEKSIKRIKEGDEDYINAICEAHGVGDDFFAREPFPHQKAGMAFFLASWGHVCFFDEMRTGKTFQAINIARYLIREGKIKGVLVLCPNSIKYVWQEEFMLDAPLYACLSTVVAGTKDKKRKLWSNAGLIWITNYECARADKKELYAWAKRHREDGWLLICDEAHVLRNKQTQQSKVVLDLDPDYSVFMTGTPISSFPEDAFNMVDFVCPGLLGSSVDHFRKNFGTRGGFRGKQMVGYHDLDEIKYRLTRIAMRRRRSDIMFDQMIYQNRYGELKGDQAKAYEEIRELLYTEFTSIEGYKEEVAVQHSLTKVLRLYQISAGYLSSEVGSNVWFEDNWKEKELDNFIRDYLDSIGKLVIWSRFVPPLFRLTAKYKEQYGAVMIKGQMGKEADENMYRFQRDPDCRIMVSQIQTAAGRGFQPATFCWFWDKWWTPLANNQARDRITGIKNQVPITVISAITRDAIDERIEFILGQRQQWSDTVLGDTNLDITLPKIDKKTLLYLVSNPDEAREYEATRQGKEAE